MEFPSIGGVCQLFVIVVKSFVYGKRSFDSKKK